MAPLQNETTRFKYLTVKLHLSGSKYIEVKLKRHVICSCCLVYWMNSISDFELMNSIADRGCAGD